MYSRPLVRRPNVQIYLANSETPVTPQLISNEVIARKWPLFTGTNKVYVLDANVMEAIWLTQQDQAPKIWGSYTECKRSS